MWHFPDIFALIRWRLIRGATRDAATITRFLRYHPGANAEQITDHCWSMIPPESRRDFAQYVIPELERLALYGVIEFHNGWHNSTYPDPFARLGDMLGGWDLVDAFGMLASSYSQTVERRLAKTIACFVADDRHDDDMRRFAYTHFLTVIGVPVSEWPKRLTELHIPTGLDWRKINAFLPRKLRQRHASASLK